MSISLGKTATLVIDASVAFKWLAPEEHSQAAFDLLGRVDLIAPTLLPVEIGNALWKLARREQLDPTISFAPELASLATLVSLQDEASLVPRALTIARALSHPIYDCVYLALAEAEQTRLLTADKRFIASVQGSEWEDRVETFS